MVNVVQDVRRDVNDLLYLIVALRISVIMRRGPIRYNVTNVLLRAFLHRHRKFLRIIIRR